VPPARSEPPDSPDSPVELGILLGQAFSAFVEELHEHLRDHGHAELHRWLGYVLKALDARPHSVRELAEHLRMTPAGAVKVIDEIVAAGYIERATDEHDGRVRRLQLTDDGRALLAESRRFHARYERELAAALGQRRVATMRAVLTELVAAHGDGPTDAALRPV
jgi:DNA-binding MarR family transcriptional regulator